MQSYQDERVLVISPHTDDELFGCGGTLLKMMQERKYSIKLAVTSCTTRWLAHLNRNISGDEQWEEFINCSKHISTDDPVRFDTNERLEDVSTHLIVRWLDKLILDYQPTTVFIPEPSYHQEHQLTYKASIAACRPTYGNRDIKNVVLYEIPTNTWSGAETIFKPNLYVDITDQIDRKIEIFRSSYKLQYTKDERKLIGEKGIISHAMYRGTESQHKFSEAFMLIRSTSGMLI